MWQKTNSILFYFLESSMFQRFYKNYWEKEIKRHTQYYSKFLVLSINKHNISVTIATNISKHLVSILKNLSHHGIICRIIPESYISHIPSSSAIEYMAHIWDSGNVS